MNNESIQTLRWPEDRDKLKTIQESLGKKVLIRKFVLDEGFIAGVDAAFFKDKIIASACLLELREQELALKEIKVVIRPVVLPYIPGYLSFREGPAVIECIKKLSIKPELIVADGQGIAHPKGIGIASFIGVLTKIPAIGCAKTRLVGDYKEPGGKRGDFSKLVYEGREVGAILRTRDKVKPIFVSPGHLIDIESSIRMVMKLAKGFRLAEPVRCAHSACNRVKKNLYDKQPRPSAARHQN